MGKRISAAAGQVTSRPELISDYFHGLFESAPEGILLLDGDTGKIIDANKALVKLLGFRRSELLEKGLWEIPPLQTIAASRAAFKKLKFSNTQTLGNLSLPARDGRAQNMAILGHAYESAHRLVIQLTFREVAEPANLENAPRQSDARFRSTMDSMLEGCQIIDRAWRYVYINDAAERHNRRPKSELLGRGYTDTWPGIESTHVYALIRRCMEKRIAQTLENKFVFPDGSVGWFDLSIQPVPEGVFILSVDITARKQAEEALRLSEENIKAIVSNTPDHVLVQDRDLKYTFVVNPQLGLTEAAMLGKTDRDLLTNQADAAHLTRIKRQVLKTGRAVQVELPLDSPDGETQVFTGSYVPKHDLEGRIDGLIGYFQNVTELKRAEAELRRSEELYRNLFEAMNEGFCILEILFDDQGQPVDCLFLEVNAAFERHTGLKAARGKSLRKLAPGTEAHWFEIFGRVALTGESTRFVNEAKALKRWLEVFAYRLGQPEDRQVAVVLNDITERTRSETSQRQLNQVLRALSDSNQAMMLASDENDYMNEVCHVIVKDCGHAMVWIGLAEQDEGKSVRPVAWSGFDAGYLDKLRITWADTERGRGPTGTAIRTNTICTCTNMQTDPNFLPWREEAFKRGYTSSVVLPISVDDEPLGAINIYSRLPDAFSKEEIQILAELTHNLAYGITTLRLRAAHARAEAALAKSEERYRLLVENAPVGIGMGTLEGQPLAANPAMLHMLGQTEAEYFRSNLRDIYRDPTDRSRMLELLRSDGRVIGRKVDFVRKDGSFFHASLTAAMFSLETGPTLLAIVEDIGEATRFEETRNWLASFPEFNPSPIAELDFSGEVHYINPAARRLFPDLEAKGIEHGWLSGLQPILDGYRNGATKTIARDVEVGDQTFQQVIHCLAERGRIRLYGFDISARTQAERALRQARDELEQRVAERTRELNATNEQLQAEIAERQRLAQNLHDAVNQSLFSAGLIAEVLPRLWERDREAARQSIEDLRRLTRGAQAELRGLLVELRPAVLVEAELSELLHQLTSAFTGRTNIPVTLIIEGQGPLPGDVQIMLYRLTQEGLNNIAKHAKANHAEVELCYEAHSVKLHLHDDGRGFDPHQPARPGHFGLAMLQERVHAVGASLQILSQPGQGTELIVHWKESHRKEPVSQ